MFKMSRQDTRRQVRLNKLYGEPYTWRQVRTVRRRGFGNLPQLMWQGAGLLSYAYTTEETEKMEVMQLAAELDGNVELAIKHIAMQRRDKVNQ